MMKNRGFLRLWSIHRSLLVDAPVSGGRERAEAGNLAIIVSGVEYDKHLAFPLLRILGTPIDCGGIPSSQIVKLINQILVGCQYAAIFESLRLVEKSNLDTETIDQVINQSLGHSRVWDLAMRTIREQQAGVQARILAKDMLIVREYASSLGLELPIVASAA